MKLLSFGRTAWAAAAASALLLVCVAVVSAGGGDATDSSDVRLAIATMDPAMNMSPRPAATLGATPAPSLQTSPGPLAGGMCPMLGGTATGSGMSGMGSMSGMSGMGSGSTSGMGSMSGMAGMSATTATDMPGMGAQQWYEDPWRLLGWTLLVLVTLGGLLAIALTYRWFSRRLPGPGPIVPPIAEAHATTSAAGTPGGREPS